MLAQYERLFGTEILKCEIHAPLEPGGDHPELDESPLCDNEDHAKYMTMVGALQWPEGRVQNRLHCRFLRDSTRSVRGAARRSGA